MSTGGTKQRRRQRQAMWAKNPHCLFCGEKTDIIKAVRHSTEPSNMAVLLHLITKLMPGRFNGNPQGPRRNVIACRKCADDYGNRIQAGLPIEELWQRSGRFPMEFIAASDSGGEQ